MAGPVKGKQILHAIVFFLTGVYGAAFPDPTPAPVWERRQGTGIVTVWSPSITGTTVTYEQFSLDGTATVSSSGSFWQWCTPGVLDCFPWTSCVGGTLLAPGTSVTCSSPYDFCGTEYLFSTINAIKALTRAACYTSEPFVGDYLKSFFIVSPGSTPAPVTSSSSSYSSSSSSVPPPASSPPTHTPSPTPKPSTPIGAIVGGVIGGVAVIVLAVLGAFFIRRRGKKNNSNTQTGGSLDGSGAHPAGYFPSPQHKQTPQQMQDDFGPASATAFGADAKYGAEVHSRSSQASPIPGSPNSTFPPPQYNNVPVGYQNFQQHQVSELSGDHQRTEVAEIGDGR